MPCGARRLRDGRRLGALPDADAVERMRAVVDAHGVALWEEGAG
ncbi:hypothetical protein [Streptomyces formicae]|nr:hypothetical protein [Streptomyces formicae]